MNKITRQYTPQVSVPYQSETQLQEQKNVEIDWIGLSDKTMWDWLILFSTLAIPIVVLCATIVFSIQQERANEAQHNTDLRIAEANRQNDLKMANDQEEETTLAAYLDGLTGLLLDNKLGSPEATYDANVVARAKTMIVLHRLNDPQRKSMVVQFLYEAHLITGKQPRVSLEGADLSGANLSGANLSGANLSGADLHGANLSGANLSGANLSGANLSGAHLNKALLRSTGMRNANLRGADMRDADMTGADMRRARITSNQ